MATFIFLCIAVSLGISMWYSDLRNQKVIEKEWSKKSSFPGGHFTRDEIMEAHVSLAARMVQSDTKDAGKKVIYIDKYFQKAFPDHEYNFREVLTDCYKDPVDEKTVVRWLNIHLRDRTRKMQVMYFLAGLSHVDGSINGREMKMLHSINKLLGLTPKEFQTVISMYQQRYERKQASKSYTKKAAKKLACEIIGVAETASIDEIKKAYRKLVKIHHPDRFSNESIEQQELAEERFIEVQKAYEVLNP